MNFWINGNQIEQKNSIEKKKKKKMHPMSFEQLIIG